MVPETIVLSFTPLGYIQDSWVILVNADHRVFYPKLFCVKARSNKVESVFSGYLVHYCLLSSFHQKFANAFFHFVQIKININVVNVNKKGLFFSEFTTSTKSLLVYDQDDLAIKTYNLSVSGDIVGAHLINETNSRSASVTASSLNSAMSFLSSQQ